MNLVCASILDGEVQFLPQVKPWFVVPENKIEPKTDEFKQKMKALRSLLITWRVPQEACPAKIKENRKCGTAQSPSLATKQTTRSMRSSEHVLLFSPAPGLLGRDESRSRALHKQNQPQPEVFLNCCHGSANSIAVPAYFQACIALLEVMHIETVALRTLCSPVAAP
jgi:hypothetical protein